MSTDDEFSREIERTWSSPIDEVQAAREKRKLIQLSARLQQLSDNSLRDPEDVESLKLKVANNG